MTIFNNSGRTKLALVTHGVALPDGLPQASHWISQANAVETVLDLRLPSGHFATVPVAQPFTEKSPIALHVTEDGCELAHEGERLPVELLAAPQYYHQTTRAGARMGSFSSLHDKLLILHPLMGCGFFADQGKACQYCQYDSMLNEAIPPLRDPLELVEVVRAALAEREVDTVYLYNGHVPGDQAGLDRLISLIALLRRHLGHRQIALETVAPRDTSMIDDLYAAGLDVLICNLELFNEERFATVCPGKQVEGGQEAIWRALGHAASVFREGAVVSHLILGLEPVESTISGMKALVGHGVVPLLIPFRPLPGTPLEHTALPDMDAAEEAFLTLYNILAASGLPTHRLRDMGRVLTPMESRVLVGREVSLPERLTLTPVGRKMGGWFDALRRTLRVQHTDAETEQGEGRV